MSLPRLLGTLGVLALPFGSGSGVLSHFSGRPAHAGARARGTQNGTHPPAKPVRYRPVGCVASGPFAARTHGPRRKVVALTFDDGPSTYTRRFVQMLRAQHAVATFFMIGEQLSAGYRSVLREELRNGDALGDHTWTHPDLVVSGGVQSQLQRTKSAIAALSGYTPCVFRPPYGDYDGSVVRTARSLGLATIVWEVDPSDYTLPGVGAIEQRVLSQVEARVDRALPRRRWPARADACRLSAHHRRAAPARVSVRDRPAAARLPHDLQALPSRLRRSGDPGTAAAWVDRGRPAQSRPRRLGFA